MSSSTTSSAAASVHAKPLSDEARAHAEHRAILVVLSGLLLGMFLAALDQTIVSTAIRTIADKLHGQTEQAWVSTAYLLTSTISTPLYGKLSDQYGRKPFYLFAISIFVFGSILCGTAHSIYALAGYRAIQGIGAGGLLSLAFAIVGDLVPPRERGKYQAYFMAVFGTSSVLGPVLGGFFAGQNTLAGIDGWRWIFYLNIPIGAAALFVVATRLHLPKKTTTHRMDFLGALLLTLSTAGLLLVAEKGRDWGYLSGKTGALTLGALVALVLFIVVERRMGEEAVLPPRIFQNRVFNLTSITSFLVGAGMFGGIASIPLYLQIVKQESPTKAGLLLTPLMVGIIFASGISGKLMMKTGRYKRFPILGTALMFTAMLCFSTLKYDTPLWHPLVFMTLMGLGLGLSMQTLVISVQNALPPKDMGVATSSVTFFRSMGGTAGVAVALAILFGTVTTHIKDRALAAGVKPSMIAHFGSTASLNDTSKFAQLPSMVRTFILQGFADAMHEVFLVTAVLLIPAFILACLVEELPLRSQGGLAAAKAEGQVSDGDAGTDGDTSLAASAALH